ncbi:MAG: hypothetical protein SR1Q5_10280 [Quinella sp. 1Q5]|nr:hypothetical protein [Quinella sp. 1Q5]
MSKKKLTAEQVLYCREHYKPGSAEYGLRPLAEKMGVKVDVIKDLVHGETYKDVGGPIRSTVERVPAEVKAILAAAPDKLKELSERYGITEERLAQFLPKVRRAKITDEVKAAILREYEPYSREYGREALAAKYGLSASAIGVILKDAPRKERVKVADYLKEAIIEAADDGLSVKALAERFSLSRPVIKSILTEAGIEVKRRRVDEETKSEIIAAYQSGKSLRELEEIYGVNRATMADWVRGLKPPKPKKELTQELREQIYRYHSQGYGATIIAKTVGISQGIVRKVIDGEL